MDEAEVDDVELVVSDMDATEAFEPAEEPLDAVAVAVALAVVGPGPGAARMGRDDQLVAELAGQAAGLIALISAIRQQRRLTRLRPQPAQQFAAPRRVARLARRER